MCLSGYVSLWCLCVCDGVCLSGVHMCVYLCLCLLGEEGLLINLSRGIGGPHLIGNERGLEICLTVQCKLIALFYPKPLRGAESRRGGGEGRSPVLPQHRAHPRL